MLTQKSWLSQGYVNETQKPLKALPMAKAGTIWATKQMQFW